MNDKFLDLGLGEVEASLKGLFDPVRSICSSTYLNPLLAKFLYFSTTFLA
jgi:hypothetical protein